MIDWLMFAMGLAISAILYYGVINTLVEPIVDKIIESKERDRMEIESEKKMIETHSRMFEKYYRKKEIEDEKARKAVVAAAAAASTSKKS